MASSQFHSSKMPFFFSEQEVRRDWEAEDAGVFRAVSLQTFQNPAGGAGSRFVLSVPIVRGRHVIICKT
jgi:hypothetical protein